MEKSQQFRVGDAVVTRTSELMPHDFKDDQLIPDWEPDLSNGFPDWMVPACLDETHDVELDTVE